VPRKSGQSFALRKAWHLQWRGNALDTATVEGPRGDVSPKLMVARRCCAWPFVRKPAKRWLSCLTCESCKGLAASIVSYGSRHGFPVVREQGRTVSAERLDRDIGARRVVLVVRTIERLLCARFPATARRAGGLAVDDRRGASKALRRLIGRQRGGGRRRPGADRRGYGLRRLHTDPCVLVPGVRLQPSIGRVPMVSRPNVFGTHSPIVFESVLTQTVEDAALG
jgi:hypothetical protein